MQSKCKPINMVNDIQQGPIEVRAMRRGIILEM